MDAEGQIIKEFQRMSGKFSAYEVFCDWVKCMALSISNSCHIFHESIWQKREEEYLETIKKYDTKEQNKFAELMALLTTALEENIRDVLGDVYMKAGLGNKSTGQFFTPFHLSVACAQLSLPAKVPERIPLNEPSCGGGGMVIAAAKALADRKVNYQRCLDVVAQDLDWKAVYMCYVQLSLLGIKAVVVQGNTLSEPYNGLGYPPERVFQTPARMDTVRQDERREHGEI